MLPHRLLASRLVAHHHPFPSSARRRLLHQTAPTMFSSSSPSSTNNNNDGNASAPATSTSGKEQPTTTSTAHTESLPAPGTSSDPSTPVLDLSGGGGSTVSLDALGPVVVNKDGTVSRVSNWEKMTQGERKTTLRVLGKRNQQRLAALRAAENRSSTDQ